jgi:hypothetical protein
MNGPPKEFDIDSLIGTPQVIHVESRDDIGGDLEPLVCRLSTWSQGCRDLPVDLRTVTFEADDSGMNLNLPTDGPVRRLDFKRDPANPKDPKVTHAQKQFCRMLGVPHGFFISNRPSIREALVKTWQSGLETDDRRAKCVARIREGGSVAMIRALVPERAVPPNSQAVVQAILDSLGGGVTLLFSHGDDKDDLVLHARFILRAEVPVGDSKYRMGFDVVCSELGACPMTVDAIIYDPANEVTYVASYGGEPFFSSKYDGLQPKDITDMFPKLLTRIQTESGDFKAAFATAAEGIYSVRQDCVSITRGKGFTDAMRRAVFHEATQATDIFSKLDLARHVSTVAKGFDSLKALVVERAAGRYINLCFARSMPEEQKENMDAGPTSEE